MLNYALIKVKRHFNLESKDLRYLKKYFSYLKNYYVHGIEAIICSIVLVAMSLPLPLASIYIIDEVITKKNVSALSYIIVFLFFFMILKSAVSSLERYILDQYNLKTSTDIKYDLHSKVLRFPSSYFHNNAAGYIVSRIENDIERISGLSISAFLEIFQAVFLLTFSALVLFVINWKLTSIAFSIIPLMIAANIYFSKKTEKEYLIFSEIGSRVYEKAYENINAVETIKLFVKENYAFSSYTKIADKEFEKALKIRKIEAAAGHCHSLINILGPLAILGYGSYQVICSNMSLGQFFAFNTVLANVYNPIMCLLRSQLKIKSSLVYLRRIGEFWDHPISIEYQKEDNGHSSLLKKQNSNVSCIKIEDMSFRYRDQTPLVFDGFNMEIKKGEKIAIMGASGCGKSTLLHILAGLNSNYSGKIYFSGKELMELDVLEHRKKISFVPQEPYIFKGSIKDNVAFGDVDVVESDIIKACYIAALDREFGKDKNSLSTIINPKILSIGQKQRIVIARALLKNADLIFFDEPTSALDDRTWRLLLERVFLNCNGSTYMVVTHDKGLAELMDRIIVVNGGDQNHSTGAQKYYKGIANATF